MWIKQGFCLFAFVFVGRTRVVGLKEIVLGLECVPESSLSGFSVLLLIHLPWSLAFSAIHLGEGCS